MKNIATCILFLVVVFSFFDFFKGEKRIVYENTASTDTTDSVEDPTSVDEEDDKEIITQSYFSVRKKVEYGLYRFLSHTHYSELHSPPPERFSLV